jgi:energy-coupling factor transporter ATP-binding protein EcfA2
VTEDLFVAFDQSPSAPYVGEEWSDAGWLLSGPAGPLPSPPVLTRSQLLPLSELSPENAERLFLRVLRSLEDVEHASLYGVPGQAQAGIDVYARLRLELAADASPRDYVTLQSKRVATLSAKQIQDAVSLFAKGAWVTRSAKFYYATTHSLRDTQLSNEIVKQTDRLAGMEIEFVPLGLEELSLHLKTLPEVVDDFFGREWVAIHCGEAIATSLAERLSRSQYDVFRAHLRKFYSDEFRLHSSQKNTEVFEVLDVTPRTRESKESRKSNIGSVTEPASIDQPDSQVQFARRKRSVHRRSRVLRDFGDSEGTDVRLPLLTWLSEHRQALLVGAPGAGKSTFLRFLAADLLSDSPRSSALVLRSGEQLPLWIPFEYLCRHLSESTSNSMLSAARAWLDSHDMHDLSALAATALRDKRLLLIVDGVDEWTTADDARRALELLESFVNASGSRAIISARPYALSQVPRRLPWAEGNMARLNKSQISSIVQLVSSDPDDMIANLEQSHDATSLAGVPLFLSMLIEVHRAGRFRTTKLELIDEFVQRFLADMPRLRPRRSATPIGDDEARKALSELAWRLRSENVAGLSSESDTRSHLVEIVVSQIGVGRRTAIEWAKEIFDSAEERFAVLVPQGAGAVGFVHRLILEHLAGEHVASQPLEFQVDELELRLDDPSWREVLIAAFAKSNHLGQLEKRLLELLDAGGAKDPQRWEFAVDLLAARPGITIAASNRIAHGAAERVESHWWLAHRARLAYSLGEAAGDSLFDDAMLVRMQGWVQGVVSDPRRGIWAARKLPVGHESRVEKLLHRGLRGPEFDVRLTAADAFAARYKDTPFDESMLTRIRNEQDTETQAAMLMAAGWSWRDAGLRELIGWAGSQPSISLRSVALNLRHKWGEIGGSDDLTPGERWLIRSRLEHGGWTETWTSLIHPLIPFAFSADDLEDRDRVLAILSEGSISSQAARQVAYVLACGVFSEDPRFRQWAIAELEDKHPFLSYNASMLPAAWGADPAYEAAALGAIRRYTGGLGGGGVERIPGLARTSDYRDALISRLDTPRPVSLAAVLLDNFSEDEVAANAIRGRLGAGAEQAGAYSYLAVRVLGLRGGLLRLIEFAKHAASAGKNESFDVARNALAFEWARLKEIAVDVKSSTSDQLEASELLREHSEEDLAKLCIAPDPAYVDWGLDEYLHAFTDTNIARLKAREWLDAPYRTVAQVPEVLPGAVIAGFGDAPDADATELVNAALDLMTFLDPELREIFVQGLGHSRMDLDALTSIAGSWVHDSDEGCVRAWAVALGSRLRTEQDSLGAHRVRSGLRQLLTARGTQADENRQAAWLGILISNELDLLDQREEGEWSPAIDLRRHYTEFDEQLVARVAIQWDRLRSKYGDGLEQKLQAPGLKSGTPDSAETWAALAGAPEKAIGLEDDLRAALRATPSLQFHPRVVQWVAGGQFDGSHLAALVQSFEETAGREWPSDATVALLRKRADWQVSDDEISAALSNGPQNPPGAPQSPRAGFSGAAKALHVELLPDHPISAQLLTDLVAWFESERRGDREWNWEGVTGVSIGGIDPDYLPDLLLRVHSRLVSTDDGERELLVAPARRRLARDRVAADFVASVVRGDTTPPPAHPFFEPIQGSPHVASRRMTLAFLLASAKRLDLELLRLLENDLRGSGEPMINPITNSESAISAQLVELRDLVQPFR